MSPYLCNTCDGIRIKQSPTTSRCYYVMAGRVDNKSLSHSRILNSIYYDTKQTGSFGGIDRLRRASHPALGASVKEVRQWLSEQDTYTLHKPVRYRFRRRRVVVGGINHQWQADLVDMSRLKRYNDDHTFLLIVIDVFSKKAWSIPLKNKSASSLTAAFRRLLKNNDGPQTMQTDKGKEFLNRQLQDFYKQKGIRHFTTHNEETKACIVERFNRTLKTRMWKYFTKYQTLRYLDVVQHLVDSYNASYHRSIGMSPTEVNVVNQEKVWQRLYGTEKTSTIEPGLKVDDRVRISKAKRMFKKGYLPNWSDEIFTVKSVHRTDPPVYRLIDDQGSHIEGTFYEPELQKLIVTKDKVYRIEKVLQQRKRGRKAQVLVKWLGYPESFNSWMDKSSLVSYKG